ncbi:MAG: serine/threonine protein kinase [Myxococcaceae bacterium]
MVQVAPCAHCGSKEGTGHACAGQKALIGQTLDGRYTIEKVLGQGGMGMVFLATQTSMRRPVAIKTLHPALAAAPTFFERFRREAEVASNLRHPNIITVFDFGKAPDGTCYYVMEYLAGESLKQIVKRDGPMSLRRASELIEQSARGLAHAHEKGAIHRDLKPHNIMVQRLDGADFVKVLDFGLVKAAEQDEEDQLTSTGQVLGTPQYMPPEQAGGEAVDRRSDLYSLAGVFYYCLTGTSPFGANTVRKALKAALTEVVPPVSTHRMGAAVPPALDGFFRKALSREKEDRHQDAAQFVNELFAALEGLSDAQLDAVPNNAAPAAQRDAGTPSGIKRAPSQRRGASRAPIPAGVELSGERQAIAPLLPPRTPSWTKRASIGASVLIAIAGITVVFLPKSQPHIRLANETPVGPPPRVRPPPIKLELNSVPPGATVYEGQRQVGQTPVTLSLDREREHRFTFKLPGYNPVQQLFEFRNLSDERTRAEIKLDPVAAAKVSPPPREKTRAEKGPDKPAGIKKKSDIDIPVFE